MWRSFSERNPKTIAHIYMCMVTMVYFLQSFGDGCNVTVNKCDILSWTEWVVCTNESGCNMGDNIRKARICCQLNSSLQQCMDQCNLTDSDVIMKGLVFHCWLYILFWISSVAFDNEQNHVKNTGYSLKRYSCHALCRYIMFAQT